MKTAPRFPERLGIYFNWGVGDWLLFTPALRAIKEVSPRTRIYVLAHERNEYFLGRSRYVDGYSISPDPSVFKKHFSSDEKVLVFEFLSVIWRAKCRKHLVDLIFKVLGLHASDRNPEIALDEKDDRFGRDLAKKLKGRMIVFSDKGASPLKQWGRQKWEKVIKKFPGWFFVQIGELGDVPCRGAVNLIGKTTLPQAISVVRHARLFAGSDGLFSHIANFYGVPKVILWGADAPFNYAYEGAKTVNLWAKNNCSPCYYMMNGMCARRMSVPSKPPSCMEAIGADTVCAAIKRMVVLPSSCGTDAYYAGTDDCCGCAYAHQCRADFFFRKLSDLYFFLFPRQAH